MSLTRREREKIRDFFDLIFFYLPGIVVVGAVSALLVLIIFQSKP